MPLPHIPLTFYKRGMGVFIAEMHESSATEKDFSYSTFLQRVRKVPVHLGYGT
jgi:hypothetical protein